MFKIIYFIFIFIIKGDTRAPNYFKRKAINDLEKSFLVNYSGYYEEYKPKP